MHGQEHISEVFVGIIRDHDGTEGMGALTTRGGTMPLLATSRRTYKKMRLLAREMATKHNLTVTMARFFQRDDVEVIKPQLPLKPLPEGFVAEKEPKLIPTPDHAWCERVMVAGIVQDGEPALLVAMDLRVGSQAMNLPVMFVGPIVDSLASLVADGYKVVKAQQS